MALCKNDFVKPPRHNHFCRFAVGRIFPCDTILVGCCSISDFLKNLPDTIGLRTNGKDFAENDSHELIETRASDEIRIIYVTMLDSNALGSAVDVQKWPRSENMPIIKKLLQYYVMIAYNLINFQIIEFELPQPRKYIGHVSANSRQ